LTLVFKRGEALDEEHARRQRIANHVLSNTMYILIGIFLTSLLITLPLLSFAAVFDVKDEDQMKEALNTAGSNKEADIINILSDMTLSESLKYFPEDYPLTINGNSFSISGNEKYRCLDIKDRKLALSNAHIAIHNLTFSNGSDLAAGGLLVNYRSPNNSSNISITGCTFKENKARLWEIGWGGGSYIISYNGNISIQECNFINNSSAGGAGGVKIEASGSGNISVTGCSFIGNTAAIWYGGALVHAVGGGRLEFKGNVVAKNTSHRRPAGGVGIWVGLNQTTGGHGTVYNNLNYGNKSPEVSGMYAWVRGGYEMDILNNTVASNPGNIGLYLRAEDQGDSIRVYNNIVWQHAYDIIKYSAGEGSISGGFNCYGTGKSDVIDKTDLNKSPEFIGGEDFHLKEKSPCIDVGFTGSIVPDSDIEGNKRPQGQGVDIGAYEFIPIK
jgi:hypothetical protein